jgi:hypothetical protein
LPPIYDEEARKKAYEIGSGETVQDTSSGRIPAMSADGHGSDPIAREVR